VEFVHGVHRISKNSQNCSVITLSNFHQL